MVYEAPPPRPVTNRARRRPVSEKYEHQQAQAAAGAGDAGWYATAEAVDRLLAPDGRQARLRAVLEQRVADRADGRLRAAIPLARSLLEDVTAILERLAHEELLDVASDLMQLHATGAQGPPVEDTELVVLALAHHARRLAGSVDWLRSPAYVAAVDRLVLAVDADPGSLERACDAVAAHHLPPT